MSVRKAMTQQQVAAEVARLREELARLKGG
jgi:hypothetical protein